jgi:4-hydroxyphenylpyruvate dioxygenase-like putative hemolysin
MQLSIAAVSLSDGLVEKLEAIAGAGFKGVLYDRDGTAEYLQVYTETFDDRFFFEIVERRGYKGFGAANAPVRLAAQSRRVSDLIIP